MEKAEGEGEEDEEEGRNRCGMSFSAILFPCGTPTVTKRREGSLHPPHQRRRRPLRVARQRETPPRAGFRHGERKTNRQPTRLGIGNPQGCTGCLFLVV